MDAKLSGFDVLPDGAKPDAMIPLAAYSDEEFQKLCRSMLIVVTHRSGEGVQGGLCGHFGIWARLGIRFSLLKDPNGGFIETTRGAAERLLLDSAQKESEIRYIVLIDNDQEIPWDAPLQLVRHGLPIVSGVMCAFNNERGIFACFTAYDEKGVPRFPTYRFTKMFPGKGIQKVHQVGTGLLAIRRDVFETLIDRGECAFMIPEALRRESYRVGYIKQGEDFSFCEKARAAGFDIHVDFGVRGLHYKTIGLGWPEELLDEQLDAKDWQVSNLDYRGLIPDAGNGKQNG